MPRCEDDGVLKIAASCDPDADLQLHAEADALTLELLG
jgi:hypothetical protein